MEKLQEVVCRNHREATRGDKVYGTVIGGKAAGDVADPLVWCGVSVLGRLSGLNISSELPGFAEI